MVSLGNAVPGPRGRTRWKRFGLVLLPALAAAGVLVLLTAQAVLAVSFSISGTPFNVTARELKGQGFEQFVDPVNVSGHGDPMALTVNAIRSATLSHLCQSVSVAGVTLKITAGDGSTPVTATDLVVDANKLSAASATFSNINIGQDASTLSEVPGVRGPKGEFAQQAATVTIRDLFQHAYATTAGTFTLPGLSISFGGSCK